jgi:glycosyltransferase involved in cell wall biosynthesis/ADP-heptose:LPS heptosyltransferase
MRIVIDMQGAQTESRFRGIGRYSLSLALAIVRQKGEHEVVLALSGLFPETIEPIRIAFDGLLPQANIVVWDAPGPTRETNPDNALRRAAAERLREAFLLSLQPDVVLVTSLFEGFGDDAITSVGQFDNSTPTAVILYDLIPLINPDEHFLASKLQQNYYQRKIVSLKQTKLLLAISDSARQEALTALKFDPNAVINVSGAFDDSFKKIEIFPEQQKILFAKLNIDRPFVFYTGGADERKNLHRLIEAYAGLPQGVRSKHQLVLAGKMPVTHVESFKKTASKHGLSKDDLIFTGFIADEDLLKLFNLCTLFVFPSLHEGFGIPPLEAMACGAPVIGACATSLPEVIGLPEALFDPSAVEDIRDKLNQALADEAFRDRLIKHGLAHSKTFTWDDSARKALTALARFALAEQQISVRKITVESTTLYRPENKKILLLKLDHLGDFILAIPAITRLKARYPFADIDLVVGSWSVPLAQSLNIFKNIYTLDYFKKKSSESATASARVIDELLSQFGKTYDFAVDLRRQRDTRFILAKMPAAFKVGYESFDPKVDSQLNVALTAHADSVFEVTALNRTPITVQMTRLIDALPESPNDYVTLPDLIPKASPQGLQIAVFPKAGNDVKEWPRDNYAALISQLAARRDVDGVNVYFANQKEADDYALAQQDKVHVYPGLDLPSLMRSLSDNVLCIANNSFGAHIGGYLGLVVIGIYGGHETVAEWAPVFNSAYVIHHPVACSPCHIAHRS